MCKSIAEEVIVISFSHFSASIAEMAFTAHPQLIHLKGVCLKCKTHQGGVCSDPQVHCEKSLELQLGQNPTHVTSVEFVHPIVGKAIDFSGTKHNL